MKELRHLKNKLEILSCFLTQIEFYGKIPNFKMTPFYSGPKNMPEADM